MTIGKFIPYNQSSGLQTALISEGDPTVVIAAGALRFPVLLNPPQLEL